MSSEGSLFLRPLAPLDALQKALSLATALFPNSTIGLQFHTNVAHLHFTAVAPSTQIHHHESIKKFTDIFAQFSTGLECSNFSVGIHKDQSSPLVRYKLSADGLSAVIELQNVPQADNAIQIISKLSNMFTFISRSTLLAEHLPGPQQDLIKSQSIALADLHSAVSKIAQFNLEQVKEHSDFLRKATIDLDARSKKQDEELESKREAIDKQYRTRLEELEQREREHQKKVDEYDAKENMLVRRKLLTEIKDLIKEQEKFSLSENVYKKRYVVHGICSSSAIAAIVWILYFLHRINSTIGPKWYDFAPLSAGVIFLVSTIVFYIKWNDQWIREHAQAELRNKKLNADILRASWLAEMFFEGNDKEHPIPDMLVSRFSEGLFADTVLNSAEHPTDQMLDLIKKVSAVKVGKDSVEITKSAAKES